MSTLIGTAPDQVPVNGMLGGLAFQDIDSVKITDLTYTGTLTGSTGVLNIGSGQVYKDASGNVGIGTTAPTNKLTVNGGIDFSGSAFSGSGTGIWQQATNKLGFVTAGSTRLTIDATGNVGIGTTTPTGKLDVIGTIKTLGYTVATLPTGVVGARAYVTDALAPTFGAIVVTGGAITIPVFYNGTNWIVG